MDNIENYMLTYFPFIPSMPVMVIKNIFQGLGVANGSIFIVVDVILNPLLEWIELSNGVVIYNMPLTNLLITFLNT
jgi:hypothetical protein